MATFETFNILEKQIATARNISINQAKWLITRYIEDRKEVSIPGIRVDLENDKERELFEKATTIACDYFKNKPTPGVTFKFVNV